MFHHMTKQLICLDLQIIHKFFVLVVGVRCNFLFLNYRMPVGLYNLTLICRVLEVFMLVEVVLGNPSYEL